MGDATTMTKDLKKRLYAFAMFDGCLIKQSNKTNASLIVKMLQDNEDYIDKVITALEEVPVGYKKTMSAINDKEDYKHKQQTRLQSYSHPVFTKIRNRIYIEGRKVVDPHMLTLMDEEMLAIMLMTSGSRTMDKRRVNACSTYRLHLNNLSYGDLMLIKTCIKKVFNMETNIRKKGLKYDLVIPTFHSCLFEEIVSPFILPSFQYKVGR